MAANIEGLMTSAMDKVRELVDIQSIVGEPITSPDGTIIIPVSRVSFGFVSGGSDIPTSVPSTVFGGGAGAGVTIRPAAFIVIKTDGDVRLLETGVKESAIIEGITSGIPELLSKVKAVFSKGGDDD